MLGTKERLWGCFLMPPQLPLGGQQSKTQPGVEPGVSWHYRARPTQKQ
jgi:hypothetical protein